MALAKATADGQNLTGSVERLDCFTDNHRLLSSGLGTVIEALADVPRLVRGPRCIVRIDGRSGRIASGSCLVLPTYADVRWHRDADDD
jgi:hypothetical protein